MTKSEILSHIAHAIEEQGKHANMYIPGIGAVMKDGIIDEELLDNFVREAEEYKAQQEYRK
jgi:hypothetical protein